jgi:hypothetical protein
MSKINTIFTFKAGVPTSFVAIVNRKQYTADSSHNGWDAALEAIRNDNADALVKAIDVKNAVASYTVGNVRVVGNSVFYGTTRLGDSVVQRVLDFMNNNLDVTPFLKFLNKLHSNPSSRAVQELYSFLQHKNMPITSDGNFRAYKGLREDFYSISSGTLTLLQGKADTAGRIYNGVGETIECVRNGVDDNKDNTCSYGLHAGSLEYASGFAQGKLVIVEINPADVVSIPSDCNGQKLRTCKYTVVAEYEQPLDSVYINTATGDSTTKTDDSTDYDAGYEAGYDDGNDGNAYASLSDESDAFRDGYEDGYEDGEADANAESYTDEDGHTYGAKSKPNYHNKRDASGRFIKA